MNSFPSRHWPGLLDVVAYDPYLRREHSHVDGISLVDQAALTNAPSRHRLAGAGLDVFETEPLSVYDPLRWSVESSAECRRVALEHVVTVLRGGVPTDVVNRAVLERLHAN